ncbi:MAG: helix-turn-helix domain-containing protein [Flavobacteriales bacterium]
MMDMKIGNRIRKVREIKGYSQENLASELGMSITGYGKIERDEVSINMDRLQKISHVLGVGVETIIGFDENVAFNNFNSKIEQQIGRYDMPIEMKKLYEENIQLLKEKILYLEAEIALLKKK